MTSATIPVLKPKGRGANSFLGRLPPGIWAEIASIVRPASYPAGHKIVSPLATTTHFLVVLDGLVKVSAVTTDGLERILYVYRPGEVIGLHLLRGDESDPWFDITTLSPVKALAIAKRDFLALAERHPAVLLAVAADTARQFDRALRRLHDAMSMDVPTRLGRLLLDFASPTSDREEFVPLFTPLTHDTMAQIVASSRPHTSTVLRHFEEAGAVRRRNHRGILVNPQRLREILQGQRLPLGESYWTHDPWRMTRHRPEGPALRETEAPIP